MANTAVYYLLHYWIGYGGWFTAAVDPRTKWRTLKQSRPLFTAAIWNEYMTKDEKESAPRMTWELIRN